MISQQPSWWFRNVNPLKNQGGDRWDHSRAENQEDLWNHQLDHQLGIFLHHPSDIPIWTFPEIGVPPVIIHFYMDFPMEMHHPASLGYLHFILIIFVRISTHRKQKHPTDAVPSGCRLWGESASVQHLDEPGFTGILWDLVMGFMEL